jgi:hypothetical protein
MLPQRREDPIFKLGRPLHFNNRTDFMFHQIYRRTPTGTLLSNRMRNAMTLGVSQDGLDKIQRHLELFRDFRRAHTIVEVVDNRVDWHPRATQHRRAARHARVASTRGRRDQSILSSGTMAAS